MATDLRPLSLGELLDRTFTLYRKHFVLFVGIMAVCELAIIASATVSQAFLKGATLSGRGPGSAALLATGLLSSLLQLLVTFMAYSIGQAATVNAVSAVYLDRPITVNESFRRIRGKVWPVVAVVLGTGVLTTVGFVFCIAPGVILAILFALAVQSVVLEGRDPLEAVKRSIALGEGRRGELFLVLLLFYVLKTVVVGAFVFPVTMAAIAYLKEGLPWWLEVLQQLAAFVSGSLVGPFLTIALSLFYYDQRVRKEAFDLQFMLAAVEGTPAPPPTITPGPSLGPA